MHSLRQVELSVFPECHLLSGGSLVVTSSSSITFLLKSIAPGSRTPAKARPPLGLRLAGLSWEGAQPAGRARGSQWARSDGSGRRGPGVKVRAVRRGFHQAGQLYLCQPRWAGARPNSCSVCGSRQEVELWVSLCQPGAEINALSWFLGSRKQGRAGSGRPRPLPTPSRT